MGVTIRPATPADYDRIAVVVDDWWGRPLRHALPRLFLDHFHNTSFVAEEGDELRGFLIGFVSPANRQDAYVHFVGVDPSRRRCGLGRELYERFFALARHGGRSRVRAVTAPANEGSVAFHRRLGFSAHAVADYDGPRSAKVVFERPL
jgi:ribosomal protein S18 acetylase RimI-like enzyme